jgi:subtilisin family serine protease
MMNIINFKRGQDPVTLTKLTDKFAIRLRQGSARNEQLLEAACGRIRAKVTHFDEAAVENMNIFSVTNAEETEATIDELRKSPISDVTTHIYSMEDAPGSEVIPTGLMTIQFASSVSHEAQEEILKEFGLEIIKSLDFLPAGFLVKLTSLSPENPLKIALKLQIRESIQIADPDLAFRISFKHHPFDSLYKDQWHLKNNGGSAGMRTGADVKAEGAWEISRGSREISVCVMDDGFDLQHPDFDVPGKIVSPRDFGQDDFQPNPVNDTDNHGTACAGVAVAEENGTGVVGLAPQCTLMPIRTSGWLSDNSITDLFQYAIDNHADVISCSWSASSWNFPLSTIMTAIIHKTATEGRRNHKGCLILFAAGNENRPLKGTKDGRASHQGFALHADVIAVGASNSLDEKSDYSNFGKELTLCAPSSGSPGKRIVTTDRRGTRGYNAGDYTYSFGGTSSSTPLAAGLAALILSQNSDLSSAEVKQIMIDTADKIDSDNGNYVDGHSQTYGYGRINAEKALQLASGSGEDSLPQVLSMEHRIHSAIPDLGTSESVIPFPLDVIVKQIEVSMEITHTWSGDLQVILTSPQGHEIILQDRTGGNIDNIAKTFRSADEPGRFNILIGKSAKGDWRLKILDMAAMDVGMLVKWGVSITY